MIDRLIKGIQKTENPTVVGLDPTYAMIPSYLSKEMFDKYGKTPQAVAKMFLEFNKQIIDNVHDLIPAVKPQIAMYENYGLAGIETYIETIAYAKSKGLIVIGDIKRGDIASTAAAYSSHIGITDVEGEKFDIWGSDCVTLNPYMGYDAIEPFISNCNEHDKGMFVLVKTSNPHGGQIQDLIVGADKEKVYEKVAKLVAKWGEEVMGELGYSKIGAVVGATYPEDAAEIRKLMPNTYFLVPGYGAQGAGAEKLKGCFNKDGLGAIVNSSRGIIAAYKENNDFDEKDFAKASRAAVIAMKEDLQRIL
ncbi:MAG TPA: orotidine-5'-phosphate decarboxylase [Epulopiscium sp.]|nr:orotidine-5'-phosphate decarboxylase [Candidatus Epulonipiscium sp.]